MSAVVGIGLMGVVMVDVIDVVCVVVGVVLSQRPKPVGHVALWSKMNGRQFPRLSWHGPNVVTAQSSQSANTSGTRHRRKLTAQVLPSASSNSWHSPMLSLMHGPKPRSHSGQCSGVVVTEVVPVEVNVVVADEVALVVGVVVDENVAVVVAELVPVVVAVDVAVVVAVGFNVG